LIVPQLRPLVADGAEGAESKNGAAGRILTFKRLLSSTAPEFAALVRLYTETHPASERKSLDWLCRMVKSPQYFFRTATRGDAVDASVVGFSISICFRDSEAALLEYMAVAAQHRNQGIGRILFHETVNSHPLSERPVLIEVDSDRTPLADHEERVRRKSFYRSLGCREIEGLRYRMPRVSSATPPAMELLVYKDHLPQSIDRPRLLNWLETCFDQVYELPDAGQVGPMLEDLPQTLRLI
jgi:GNAT superfamily N-acetyltransferase